MKIISLISINQPGLDASEKVAADLNSINSLYKIIIYFKQGNKPANLDFAKYRTISSIDEVINKIWSDSDAIIWFTSTGIVIRKIANLIDSKQVDPAIIVINLDITQIIPLLSGHIGGANELVRELTSYNKNLTAFITTATDSLGLFAFDLFAKSHNYPIVDIVALAKVSNFLVNDNKINLVTFPIIKDLLIQEGLDANSFIYFEYTKPLEKLDHSLPTVVISPFNSNKGLTNFNDVLFIRLKPVSLGIGINSGTSFSELSENILNFIEENSLSFDDINSINTFIGKNNEEALLQWSKDFNKQLNFFTREDINTLDYSFSASKAEEYLNIKGVAEPCAILGSQNRYLFIKKRVFKNITISAAF